ncbi:hypothetical protein [Spirosoma sordidisoli]|uniref:Uncharacterized protein n=1 Tax=Spirosoma sordidisoli TaxID=2502893 RepID=A0A4Q2US71_9BACT|nr:hypothetical protein [Spirosoma sordidisoli]RYC70711.1 hypothetical protein EQG79_00735 [Spirosoma sordidisoli]
MRIRYVSKQQGQTLKLSTFPSFAKNDKSSRAMAGPASLLVSCGGTIYNVSSNPDIYNQAK